MTDPANKISYTAIRNFFDARPKSILLTFNNAVFYEGMDVGEQFGPISEINFPTNGLTFLLGKNGSGKSNLLAGLTNLNKLEHNSFSKANLTFDLPTKELLKQWSEIVYEEYESPTGIEYKDFYSGIETGQKIVDKQLLELPIILSVVKAITNFVEIYPAPFRDLSSSDILQFFEFTDEQVNSWHQLRLEQKRATTDPNDPHGGDIVPKEAVKFIEKYNLGNYALEGFLNGFRKSNISNLHSGGPFPSTDPQDWSSSVTKRKLFSQTYIEFFNSISQIRISRNHAGNKYGQPSRSTSKWNVQLLCPIGASTILNSFTTEYQTALDESRIAIEDSDTPDDLVQHNFPFDLITPITIGNETYLQSNYFPLPDVCVSDLQFNPVMLLDVKIFDSSIASRSQNDIFKSIENRFLSVRSHELIDGRLSLTVDGYSNIKKLFEEAELAILDLGMGISGLRHTSLSPGYYDIQNYLSQGFSFALNSLYIEPEWRDKHSGTWLPLSKASLGQQDVIVLFLHLSYLSNVANSHRFKLFLVDEFDKHLHPNAAEIVLQKLHEIAVENELAVIVSTHAIPRIKSNILLNRPRIYSERIPESGWFKYSSGGYVDPLTVAEILGTSEIDALRLKELIVVLEGEHDQIIFEKYLRQFETSLLERIHITHATGLDGFQGVWNNMMRLLESRILFVYDKKDSEIESKWQTIKDDLRLNPNTARPYLPLQPLLNDIKRPKSFSVGDHEKGKILYLLQDVCKYREDIMRVDIHGIAYDDIVDSLPIKHFWNKDNQNIKSWTEAHYKYPTGRKLKDAFEISTGKIINVLNKIPRLEDKELSQVLSKIVKILK